MLDWLLDTNIALRGLYRGEPEHQLARDSVRILRARGDTLYVTLQCLTEFWNVSTRPRTARGGFGLSVPEAHRFLRLIARHLVCLADTDDVQRHWSDLVAHHSVVGVQVYDARLVAAMQAHHVPRILTFNTADFQRYPGIFAAHPRDVVNGKV